MMSEKEKTRESEVKDFLTKIILMKKKRKRKRRERKGKWKRRRRKPRQERNRGDVYCLYNEVINLTDKY